MPWIMEAWLPMSEEISQPLEREDVLEEFRKYITVQFGVSEFFFFKYI